MHPSAFPRRLWWLIPAALLLFLAVWLVPRIPTAYRTLAPSPPAPSAINHGNHPMPTASVFTAAVVRTAVDDPARAVMRSPRNPIIVSRPRDEEHAIRLVTHLIGTAAASPAGVPASQAARAFAGSDAKVWIVQWAGAVREADKAALAAAGATVCGYVPNNAFAVKAPASVLGRLAAVPGVQWIGPYLPDYKLAPMLDPAAGGTDILDISTFSPADVAAAATAIAAAGGRIVARKDGPLLGRVQAEIAVAQAPQLAQLDTVQWIEPFHEAVLFNNRAVEGPRLNVTNVWATHGLNGSNQIVAVADTGLDTGDIANLHTDFVGRVVLAIPFGRPGVWSDPHSHGTHVCGSVLGDGRASAGKYRGVAHAAQLMIESLYNSGGGLTIPPDLFDLFHPVYTNGARIHSDSWGSTVFGFYTSQSRDVDEYIWAHPDMSVFFAASNDGEDGNSDGVVDLDSLGSPATAKNTVSVGASENFHNSGEASGYINGLFSGFSAPPLIFDSTSQPYDGVHQGMAAFSSRGPCDDGRVKPDIVAPGTDVISTRSRAAAGTAWGVAPDNTSYLIDGGTSMSTPLAAGCAALMRQYFAERTSHTNPSAALIKATMINGARSLFPGQYGTGDDQEIPGGPRPNNVEGWGQIDVEGTLFPAAPVSVAYFEGPALATGETNLHLVNLGGTNALRVTLCWSDFPGSPGSSKSLVNDLDLRVIAPDGTTNFHRLQAAPDHTNNVEGIDFTTTAPGLHRIEVSGFSVPEGPQPYALVLRGPLAPTIAHEPLANTTNTVSPYAVDAAIVMPSGVVDTNQLFVRWNTDGSTNFADVPMVRATNDTFRGEIPAQPLGTRVHYYITAATNGLDAVHPAGAPLVLHSFQIVPPVLLAVLGSPLQVGDVVPPYGIAPVASGVTVVATAPAFAATPDLKGYLCTGWAGNGSVPAFGSSNTVVFQALETSFLAWLWQHTSYGLAQTSQPAGIVATTTWWSIGSTGTTIAAPASAVVTGLTHRFAGWYEAGLRLPNASGHASFQQGGFAMGGAHSVSALYVSESRDTDSDGLPDWWEIFHYGTNSANALVDDDGDGFTNLSEYGDRTDPHDLASKPSAPVIVHVPLADPQPHPAPFTVAATVTDNYAVASATLWWYRGAPPWIVTNMTPGTGNVWQADIPAPGTNFDTFAYLISANDPGGRATMHGVHAFTVGYPVMIVTPADLGTNLLARGTTGLVAFTVANVGNGPLAWTARVEQIHIDEDVEAGAPGWSHSGINDEWHISSVRPHGGTKSWYLGNDTTHLYQDAEDARLLMPPLALGSNAVLSFWSWLRCELDSGNYAWDGGVIEVSTNGGASFFSVTPDGGYPYLITPNPDSPFPAETPCLAGSGGWEYITVNLAAFANQTILARFRFGSDHFTVEEGWFIDDITVRSQLGSTNWLGTAPALGVVAKGASSNVMARLDASAVVAGDYRGEVAVEGSDEFNPAAAVGVALRVRNAPEVSVLFAAQTSTNGKGMVTVSNLVFDGDGDAVALRAELSVDAGLSWTGAWIATASAATGTVAVSNAAAWQLNGIAASATNRVVFVWPSTGMPAVAVCSNTLLRLIPWDGVFTGTVVTGAAFIVDNVPPSASNAVVVMASAFGNYVVAPQSTVSWSGFADEGFGVARYYLSLANGGGSLSGAQFTGSSGVVSGLVGGVTNTVFVWAADSAGNIGPAAWAHAVPLFAQADADGDGYPNADEETAGTSATNATSWLRLTEIRDESPARRVLRWPYVTNRVYLLHCAPEAGGTADLILTNPPVEVVAGVATFDLTNAPSASPLRQFRLGVQALP